MIPCYDKIKLYNIRLNPVIYFSLTPFPVLSPFQLDIDPPASFNFVQVRRSFCRHYRTQMAALSQAGRRFACQGKSHKSPGWLSPCYDNNLKDTVICPTPIKYWQENFSDGCWDLRVPIHTNIWYRTWDPFCTWHDRADSRLVHSQWETSLCLQKF